MELIKSNTDKGISINNPKDNYYMNFKSFLEYLAGAEINEYSIREYFIFLNNEYREGKLKARSVQVKRQAVKTRIRDAFYDMDFNVKARLEDSLKKIDKEIKAPKINSLAITDSKIVTAVEYQELLKACKTTRQKLYVIFLMKSACRVSEMINIRLTDINKQGDVSEITIRGKGSKERLLRVETDIIDKIVNEFNGQLFLFETENGNQCDRKYITTIIKKIGKRIGRDISAHTLRHSFATLAIQKFPDKVTDISRRMGHSDIRTFLTFYVHNDLSDVELLSII